MKITSKLKRQKQLRNTAPNHPHQQLKKIGNMDTRKAFAVIVIILTVIILTIMAILVQVELEGTNEDNFKIEKLSNQPSATKENW